ncbi:thymidine phosphorylase [Anaerovorax odorimutans]|uniref:thymidine phosphorylase n=1 Tax=Anaerovorax odorimutans TaxID=109327 RepID=UPI000412348C|nr:thymidine phosphorylase [Anaerovorax odorimutans]
MNMYDIIYKKREGGILTKDEIDYFVKGYTNNNIPDYQAAALLMAIFLKKMNNEETFNLTASMKNSGDIIDLSSINGIKVDKHSTGGVGDKTTLIVAPLAAAAGIPIAKMSGRGLGFTGGTIDKLESIPGFKTSVETEEFIKLVNNSNLSVIGQTAHIAPADKKIYALRDVTATVDNLSLITSSIMSKKLASGSDAIVLDVKCGNGAFMNNLHDAEKLGELMVDIGFADGKKIIAIITDMNQPLGRAIGNSNEVIEAIETLKGNGPDDITQLSLTLASYMIYIGGKASSPDEGYKMAVSALKSGNALKKLIKLIKGQGGNIDVVNDYTLFPQPAWSVEIKVTREMMMDENGGLSEKKYISNIDTKNIGLASQHLGAGRATKEDIIDLSAGIYLHRKLGDSVSLGDVLATISGTDYSRKESGIKEVSKVFSFGNIKPEKQTLIKKVIMK